MREKTRRSDFSKSIGLFLILPLVFLASFSSPLPAHADIGIGFIEDPFGIAPDCGEFLILENSDCGGGDGGSSPAVDGACSATHYDCTAGTSSNNVDGSGSWTWSCDGSGGGATASCSESKAPTATLSASPSTIDSGQSSTLTWSSTYASSCTAAGGFSTGGATSGSASTGVLTSTQNYQITCAGTYGGSVNSNIATVTVLVPTVSIGAAPDRVHSGAATTISWSATNVNSCTITRNVTAWLTLLADASRILSGSTTDTITAQTTYTISCTNNASATAAAATATKVVNVVSDFEEF